MTIMEMIKNENRIEKGIWCINDVDAISKGSGISVYLFWHQPVVNVGIHPIIQIDDKTGKTVKWAEGPENNKEWIKWIEDALYEYRNVRDFESAY